MATATRIYVVAPKVVDAELDAPERRRLVRATGLAQVRQYLASEVHVTLASQDDLVALAKTVTVEEAEETTEGQAA
jgi:hypothetical protein